MSERFGPPVPEETGSTPLGMESVRAGWWIFHGYGAVAQMDGWMEAGDGRGKGRLVDDHDLSVGKVRID